MTKQRVILIIIISLLSIVMIIVFNINPRSHDRLLPSQPTMASTNRSKWEEDKLIVIPAIWKEINWTDRSSWPLWLVEGLNPQSSYRVHLYQRIDPNSTAPYDWPYCANRHEEAGVYLQFIYEYYNDLPKKMLFIHGDPLSYGFNIIERSQCIRDDIHYASITTPWFINRPWRMWINTQQDTVGKLYRCASYLLSLFGFDGEGQLNPKNITSKENSTITAPCCAQFFVTRERVQHYTYEQWAAVYRANLQPYCVRPDNGTIPSSLELVWFGRSLEQLWHIILGLYPNDMSEPKPGTASDTCHLFRPSCKGSPCSNLF